MAQLSVFFFEDWICSDPHLYLVTKVRYVWIQVVVGFVLVTVTEVFGTWSGLTRRDCQLQPGRRRRFHHPEEYHDCFDVEIVKQWLIGMSSSAIKIVYCI